MGFNQGLAKALPLFLYPGRPMGWLLAGRFLFLSYYLLLMLIVEIVRLIVELTKIRGPSRRLWSNCHVCRWVWDQVDVLGDGTVAHSNL
jgi:hypothetical protein